MSTTLLVSLAVLAAVALFGNALLLWGASAFLGVRHPATEAGPARRLPFGRMVTLAACWMSAAAVLGVACWALPLGQVILIFNAQLVLSLAAAVVVLRLGLPVGWMRAAGVALLWGLLASPVAA